MNQGFLIIVVSFVLLYSIIPIASSEAPLPISGSTVLYVDDDNIAGPWDGSLEHPYRFIDDAVHAALPYDQICVLAGVYNETLTLEKPVVLYGEQKNRTIIDGGYAPVIIMVTGNQVSISGLTIRNSGGFMGNAGIKLHSTNGLVSDCCIHRTKTGISIDNTENNQIINCTFHSNGEGILINASADTTIRSCIFTHNAIGMNIQDSSWINIRDTYAHTNGIGLVIQDSSHIDIATCAIYNNNDNQGGIFMHSSTFITVTNCNLFHNGFCMRVVQSSSVWVDRCDLFWNTHFSIKVAQQSHNVFISNCDIFNNFRYSIYAAENSEIEVHSNNIHGNRLYGVYCEDARVHAENNWWGSPVGPSFTEYGLGDRITRKLRNVRCIPWSVRPKVNIGSDWTVDTEYARVEVSTERYEPITLSGLDSDADGVPDWWEEKWGYDPLVVDDHGHLDPDTDALNNIEECYTDWMGSNPFYKDVFLEFDWMLTARGEDINKPTASYLDDIIAAFKEHNIALHVDTGELGGGEAIPYTDSVSSPELRDLYWQYFLHNDLSNPRKGIFHYGLICQYGPYAGFAVVGWDHLDSFNLNAEMLLENQPQYDRQLLLIGGAIHELGHTLGLTVDDHGGNDNMGVVDTFSRQWILYHNYRSCMNYRYAYRLLEYSDGSHGRGDFDDWSHLVYSFFKNTHFEVPSELV